MNHKNNAVGIGAFLICSGFVAQARATSLDACGGIYLDASAAASCVVVPTETCTPKCELVAGEKVCAARLTISCDSSCTATAVVSCTSTCSEGCVPACTSQPSEPPNCMGLCMSDCQQDCNTKCAGASNQGECRSSCAQCCSNDCHDSCDAAPAADCAPVCGTACSGSCEAKANIDCQVSCQSTSFTTCKTQVVEECKNECTNTGAAIFCDGQFLATAGNLQACADQLAASFNIHLDVTVAAHAKCEGNTCSADASAKGTGIASCALSKDLGARESGLGAGFLALLGLAALRIRRNRRV